MIFLYRLILFFYRLGAKFMALFDSKAKLFVEGRVDLLEDIANANIAKQHPIWFHCASLGEFEQARSLIDALKAEGEKILITFFSPSGYEIRKKYAVADWVFYLPLDSKKNADKFLAFTNPKAAIFVKYDLWYFYLKKLQEKQTPSFLISAIYQSNQIYFKPLKGRLHRAMLGMFYHIYLQDVNSQKMLNQIDIQSTSVVGDTRVDTVLERKSQNEKLELIAQFLDGHKAIILGSAYLAEAEILAPIIPSLNNEKIIIAPHNIGSDNVEKIRQKLNATSTLYSELIDGQKANSNILIIDNIGTLFNCYQYGKWAFIGGGYGKGLHNTLEPAAFDLPVCFGPRYQKFSEAVSMVNSGAATIINDSSELKNLYSRLEEESNRKSMSKKVNDYMLSSQGATPKILKEILHKIRS